MVHRSVTHQDVSVLQFFRRLFRQARTTLTAADTQRVVLLLPLGAVAGTARGIENMYTQYVGCSGWYVRPAVGDELLERAQIDLTASLSRRLHCVHVYVHHVSSQRLSQTKTSFMCTFITCRASVCHRPRHRSCVRSSRVGPASVTDQDSVHVYVHHVSGQRLSQTKTAFMCTFNTCRASVCHRPRHRSCVRSSRVGPASVTDQDIVHVYVHHVSSQRLSQTKTSFMCTFITCRASVCHRPRHRSCVRSSRVEPASVTDQDIVHVYVHHVSCQRLSQTKTSFMCTFITCRASVCHRPRHRSCVRSSRVEPASVTDQDIVHVYVHHVSGQRLSQTKTSFMCTFITCRASVCHRPRHRSCVRSSRVGPASVTDQDIVHVYVHHVSSQRLSQTKTSFMCTFITCRASVCHRPRHRSCVRSSRVGPASVTDQDIVHVYVHHVSGQRLSQTKTSSRHETHTNTVHSQTATGAGRAAVLNPRVTSPQGHVIPGSRHPRVTSSQGHVTPGSRRPRVTSPQGHVIPGSRHHRVTSTQSHVIPGSRHPRVTSPQGHVIQGSRHPRVTSPQGHVTPGSQGHCRRSWTTTLMFILVIVIVN